MFSFLRRFFYVQILNFLIIKITFIYHSHKKCELSQQDDAIRICLKFFGVDQQEIAAQKHDMTHDDGSVKDWEFFLIVKNFFLFLSFKNSFLGFLYL